MYSINTNNKCYKLTCTFKHLSLISHNGCVTKTTITMHTVCQIITTLFVNKLCTITWPNITAAGYHTYPQDMIHCTWLYSVLCVTHHVVYMCVKLLMVQHHNNCIVYKNDRLIHAPSHDFWELSIITKLVQLAGHKNTMINLVVMVEFLLQLQTTLHTTDRPAIH